RATGSEVAWSYPGNAWSVSDLNSTRFKDLLREYRRHLRGPDTGGPIEFTKHIRLSGTCIEVEYDGVKADHLVANEFSLDFLSMLMHGRRQSIRRAAADQVRVERTDINLGVMVSTNDTSAFSYVTDNDPANLRLHRAFSDCVEVQSRRAGRFSYQMQF